MIFSIVILLLLVGFVFSKSYRLEGLSMASTYLPGQLMRQNKNLSRLDHGDVIAFRDPTYFDLRIDEKPKLVSRLIGLPGDEVKIEDQTLYVNRQVVQPEPTVRRHYRLVTNGDPIPADFLKKHHLEPPQTIAAEVGIIDLYMDTIALEEIKKLEGLKNIRPKKMFAKDPSSGFWPYSDFFAWNRDHVGPLTVPFAGLEIDISLDNIDLYRDLIENHEGNELFIDYRGVRINGHMTHSYKFQKDYYFVLDDNRDHPNDSRILGFIPKDHIISRLKPWF